MVVFCVLLLILQVLFLVEGFIPRTSYIGHHGRLTHVNDDLCKQFGDDTALQFKKKSNKSNEDSGNDNNVGFWKRLRSFVPGVLRRGRTKQEFESPAPDFTMRYQLRLLKPRTDTSKRHVITRLLRYFDDMTWETAQEIVNTSIREGESEIRYEGSIKSAKYLHDMLARSDPPVISEVYDTKTSEVIIS